MRNVEYTAAGGVVIDGEAVLILHRLGRGEVRLPKGHVDRGETAKQAAVREVTEESGYADLDVVADLGEQIVEFAGWRWGGGRSPVHREERYFLMRLRTHRTVPVHYDGLEFDPDWVSFEDAERLLTFEAEKEWVRRARAALGA